MVESIAEISPDGKTVEIDQSVQKQDIAPLLVHEQTYHQQHYHNHIDSQEAEKRAITAEKKFIQDNGGDWNSYNERMADNYRVMLERRQK